LVSLLNYHFVFIPKRRKKVLVGAIAERLQQIVCELVVENRWKIIAMEIMPDHVHLFLNVKPTDDPSGIMRKIKGRASHHLVKRISRTFKNTYLMDTKLFCKHGREYLHGNREKIY
jgi:putative transposase